MHIDTLLNSVKQQAKSNLKVITLSVASSWSQGRTLYGGISASILYQAMREAVFCKLPEMLDFWCHSQQRMNPAMCGNGSTPTLNNGHRP